jgi:hypothetical protein
MPKNLTYYNAPHSILIMNIVKIIFNDLNHGEIYNLDSEKHIANFYYTVFKINLY